MARQARGISSVAGCVVVVVVVVGAGQREPYETVSPFAGLYQLQEVTTSNDEYSVWWTWGAASGALRVGPWQWAIAGDVRRPWLEVHCRADGGPLGYSGPRGWAASLVVPLHPDEPNVPNVWHPLYWWRAGRRPRVRADGGTRPARRRAGRGV